MTAVLTPRQQVGLRYLPKGKLLYLLEVQLQENRTRPSEAAQHFEKLSNKMHPTQSVH